MSGAEAGLVLGLISSILSVIDAIKKAYDAASDASGLPEAFRDVAAKLPVVHSILEKTEEKIENGEVAKKAQQAVETTVRNCEGKVKKLEELFTKVLPVEGATRFYRYKKAAGTIGKGTRVEILMKGILEDVQILVGNKGMDTASKSDIDQVIKAIVAVSEIEPSLPEGSETTFNNTNYGDGPQTNNNVQGNMFNNNGAGNQAENMTVHVGGKPT